MSVWGNMLEYNLKTNVTQTQWSQLTNGSGASVSFFSVCTIISSNFKKKNEFLITK